MSTEFLYPFNKSSMSELYASAAALARQKLDAEIKPTCETSHPDDESLALVEQEIDRPDFVQQSEEEEAELRADKNGVIDEDSQFVNGIQLDIQALGNGDHVKRPMNA
jgi:hypothetical protein